MADMSIGKVARALEGPAYVAVGFGVLGFQRAQVRRRELQRRMSRLAGAVSQRMGEASEEVGERLPQEARDLVNATGALAHDLSREAGEAVQEIFTIGRLVIRMSSGPGSPRDYRR
jgi:hypothetical protein